MRNSKEGDVVPNFHDKLGLKNSNRTVASGGPCGWQDGDKSAVIKNVRITRNGTLVAASGERESTTVVDSQKDWWLDATSATGKDIAKGPARADALAVVTKTNGETVDVPWGESITLG
jgi:hypothetical protein